MKKELYVVLRGCYSDWSIIGYCDDVEHAMQVCAQRNKNISTDIGNDDYCYYEVVSHVESDRDVVLNYVHIVRFEKMPSGWEMQKARPEDLDFYVEGDKYIPLGAVIKRCHWNLQECIEARIPVKKNDRKKAEKIAQDMLYAFLLNQESDGEMSSS